MKFKDVIVSEEKQRLDPHCWSNKKIGNPKTKVKGGVRVNNCVPKEGIEEALRPIPVDDQGNRIPDRMSSNEPKRPFGQPGDSKSSPQGVVTYTPTGIVHRSNHGDVTPRPRAVPEGSQQVDSLVTDALKVVRGSDYQMDALKAIKTVLGDREYNGRRGHYNFYVRQLMDMLSQEGLAEADMNRRGFLKGMGAAAVAGGGIYSTQTKIPSFNVRGELPKSPMAVYLVNYIDTASYYGTLYSSDPYFTKVRQQIKPLTNEYDTMLQLMYKNERTFEMWSQLSDAAKQGIGDTNRVLTPALGNTDQSKKFTQEDNNKIKEDLINKVERLHSLLNKSVTKESVNQGVAEGFNGEYDDEAGMAQGNLYTIAKAAQGLLDTIDDNDNLPEWAQEKIAKVEGMLVTVWNYLQSQKAQGIDPEVEEMYEAMDQLAEEMAAKKGISADLVWESFEALPDNMLYETAAWRRKEGKSKKGGLNAKGVASYRRENPGSKLQTAVTTKPSKLKPGSKDANRRKSFCARMSGVKGPAKKPNGEPTRKTLALRKWNC
jgi:hypothetical protein